MANRSYRQHCGLAVALDVLAQRWTLLIVRDLLPGPRRFSDLFDGLPGISTDLLTDRLRTLQDLGLVEQRELRHPVPAKVYALSADGEDLRPIVVQLSQWGERLLPEPGSADHRLDHRWMTASMAGAYTGGLPDGSYELDLGGDLLTIEVDGGAAQLRYGPAPEPPVATLTAPAEWFMRAAWTGDVDTADPAVEASGDPAWLDDLFAAMPVPGSTLRSSR